jgi:hypothetical protein
VNIISYKIYKNTEIKAGAGVTINRGSRIKQGTGFNKKRKECISLREFGKGLLHGTERRLVLCIFSAEGLQLLLGFGELGANGSEVLVL